jgi:hypothetical protein
LLFSNPFFWGILAAGSIAMQVGFCYLSFQSFIKGDWLGSILFFSPVLLLGFLLAYAYVWWRQKTKKP